MHHDFIATIDKKLKPFFYLPRARKNLEINISVPFEQINERIRFWGTFSRLCLYKWTIPKMNSDTILYVAILSLYDCHPQWKHLVEKFCVDFLHVFNFSCIWYRKLLLVNDILAQYFLHDWSVHCLIRYYCND